MDQRDMRKRLREIPDHAPGVRVVLFREQANIVAQRKQPVPRMRGSVAGRNPTSAILRHDASSAFEPYDCTKLFNLLSNPFAQTSLWIVARTLFQRATSCAHSLLVFGSRSSCDCQSMSKNDA
jgi:hypothetical protein